MRLKHVLPALAAAALLLAGCSDEVSVKGNDESKETGTVAFEVRSVFGGEFLDSVAVVDMLTGKKVLSKNGRAVFDGLPVGDRRFSFEKDGYAKLFCEAYVELDTLSPDLPVARDLSVSVPLPKLGAKVSGRIYREIDSDHNETEPAPNERIRLYVGTAEGWLMPYIYETTTDAEGRYSFENLPETDEYLDWDNVNYSPLRGGAKLYAASNWNWPYSPMPNTLRADEEIVVDLMLQNAFHYDRAEVVGATAGPILKDDPIEILFSEPMNTEPAANNSSVYSYSSNDTVAATYSWNAAGTKLTVRSATGNWTEGGSYNVSLRLYMKQGYSVSFDENYYVQSSGDLAEAKGFEMAAAWDAMHADAWDDAKKCLNPLVNEIDLVWNKPKYEKTDWKVGYKAGGLEDYVVATTVRGDTTAVISGASLPNLAGRKELSFVLLPCNEVECIPEPAVKPLKLKLCEEF